MLISFLAKDQHRDTAYAESLGNISTKIYLLVIIRGDAAIMKLKNMLYSLTVSKGQISTIEKFQVCFNLYKLVSIDERFQSERDFDRDLATRARMHQPPASISFQSDITLVPSILKSQVPRQTLKILSSYFHFRTTLNRVARKIREIVVSEEMCRYNCDSGHVRL